MARSACVAPGTAALGARLSAAPSRLLPVHATPASVAAAAMGWGRLKARCTGTSTEGAGDARLVDDIDVTPLSGHGFNVGVNFSAPPVVLFGVGVLQGLHRARRGDDADASFVRELYAEHGVALLSYAFRLTSDRGRAEDIVQETLLRAWKHAKELSRDGRPPRPWLFTVAANLANDEQRYRRSRPTEVGGDSVGDVPGPDELDRALEAWQLAEALAELSVDHRAVLLETYYRGRTINEAAATLGIPPGTVKSRSFYALRALRLILEEKGWNP